MYYSRKVDIFQNQKSQVIVFMKKEIYFTKDYQNQDAVMMFQPINDLSPLNLPRTVEEVVDLLYLDLKLRDKVILASLSEDDLEATVYLALAKTIRKEFGLYNGNDELLNSCSSYLGSSYDRYEDPAMVIVKELWKMICEKHKLRIFK